MALAIIRPIGMGPEIRLGRVEEMSRKRAYCSFGRALCPPAAARRGQMFGPRSRGFSMQPSLSELLAQQSALDRAIREARTADKAAAVERVRRLMSEHGLTAADLVSKSPAKTGSTGKKVAPKYRDPVSGATWTGRGLKPKWLQAALDAGQSVSDFAI